jgi:hypothetical protein
MEGWRLEKRGLSEKLPLLTGDREFGEDSLILEQSMGGARNIFINQFGDKQFLFVT